MLVKQNRIVAALTEGFLVAMSVTMAWLQRAQTKTIPDRRKRVVVIGAGAGAAMLLRELPRNGYLVVALVDDDPQKAGARIHGVPVAGRVNDLTEVVRKFHPDGDSFCHRRADAPHLRSV